MQCLVLSKDTTFERADFKAGWSELLWTGWTQATLALTADKKDI